MITAKGISQGRRRRSDRFGESRTTFLAEYAFRRFPFFSLRLILPLILFNLPQFIDAIINNARCARDQDVKTLKNYNGR